MNQTKLLVLAGGFGTRLKSVVSDVPKPMAPAGGKPFLEHLVRTWYSQGIRHFTFLLHHMAQTIEQHMCSDEMALLLSDCCVEFIKEPEAMGTGGAIAYAVKTLGLDESFLVANADTYLETDLIELAQGPGYGLGAIYVEQSSRYGKLELQGDRVKAFVEKAQSQGGGWINAGIYRLHSSLFKDWDGKPFSLEQVTFPQLVAQGQLHYVKLDTPFIDIGIPEDYHRFCRWIETDKKQPL